jgi:hypothetical protein
VADVLGRWRPRVLIFDEEFERVVSERCGWHRPPGKPGRIFVGNAMTVEGSERGSGTSLPDGLMATGDVGRLELLRAV